MPDGMPDFTLTLHPRISDIPAAEWDRCAGTEAGRGNPFVSHAFLSALEDSGSANSRTGWLPQHAALRQGDALVGVAPMYAKSHSYGEYVFDHAWAHAFERGGRRLLSRSCRSAVPFSPVPGPRLLARARPRAMEALGQALAAGVPGARSVLRPRRPSAPEPEWDRVGPGRVVAAGWASNSIGKMHGYADFEDFLGALTCPQAQEPSGGSGGTPMNAGLTFLTLCVVHEITASGNGTRSTSSIPPPWTANGAAPT